MESPSPLEDWRGVDVGQIRNQLKMSVQERVHDMVEVANTMLKIRQSVRIVNKPVTK